MAAEYIFTPASKGKLGKIHLLFSSEQPEACSLTHALFSSTVKNNHTLAII